MLGLVFVSLKKQKKKIFLIIIQFVIGFIALILGLSTLEDLLRYKEQIKPLVSLEAVQIFHSVDNQEESDTTVLQKYENIEKRIKKENLAEKIGLFQTFDISFSEENSIETETTCIMPNQDMLCMTNFKLSKGSIEPVLKYNMKDKVIPVLVSEPLSKIYPFGSKLEGDTLENEEQEEQYLMEVVGVLDSSMRYWRGGSSTMTDGLTQKDENFIIAPQFKEFSSDIVYTFNTLITLSEEVNKEQTLKKIQDIYEENNYFVECTTIEQQIYKYYEKQKPVIFATLCFAAILLLLSVLGCVGTILSSILRRKEEFGIYFSMGFTKKNMLLLILGEIVVLFVVSYIVAVPGSILLITSVMGTEGYIITGRVLGMAFLIMILCVLCSVIMPLQRVNKLQPIDLINGRE